MLNFINYYIIVIIDKEMVNLIFKNKLCLNKSNFVLFVGYKEKI